MTHCSHTIVWGHDQARYPNCLPRHFDVEYSDAPRHGYFHMSLQLSCLLAGGIAAFRRAASSSATSRLGKLLITPNPQS